MGFNTGIDGWIQRKRLKDELEADATKAYQKRKRYWPRKRRSYIVKSKPGPKPIPTTTEE